MPRHQHACAQIEARLERLLLEPSEAARERAAAEPSAEAGLRDTGEIMEVIRHAVSCDVYRGVMMLDRALGKAVLIDADDISDATTCRALYDHLVRRCAGFIHAGGKQGLEQLYVLAGTVLMLNVFVRVNWTGPPVGVETAAEKHAAAEYRNKVLEVERDELVSLDALDHIERDGTTFAAFAAEKVASEFNARCVLGSPDATAFDAMDEKTQYGALLRSVIEELEVDGEPVYTGIKGLPYFVAAMAFLATLNGSCKGGAGDRRLQTVGIWQGRIAFTWQRIVRDGRFNPCPTLFKSCVVNVERTLRKAGIITGDFELNVCDRELLKAVGAQRNAPKGVPDTPAPAAWEDGSPKAGRFLENVMLATTDDGQFDCSPETGALLIIELATRLPYYNMNKLYEPLLAMASQRLDFSFAFTGRLGIRRKHQTRLVPQLMVVADGRHRTMPDAPGNPHQNGSATSATCEGAYANGHSSNDPSSKDATTDCETPEHVGLTAVNDDTDILECPRLADELADAPLTRAEQCILLSKALHLLQTSPEGDELNLEFLNAIVIKCLGAKDARDSGDNRGGTATTDTAWLLSSVALWVRCKTEYHRTKTVERATLQLHKLSDAYYENTATAAKRIEFFWHVWSPTCWDIKREIAKRMCSIGSFLTACDIYQKLHLWEDAIQCLIIVGRKADARDMVLKQLERRPTPLLWCFLGDVEGNVAHYEKAWELSNRRCARAQRTLGSYHFNKGDTKAATAALESALALNPMREASQFMLGCCYLKDNTLDRAIATFARVVALNPASSDAWANMCSAHLNMGSLQEAKLCIEQAVKHNLSKWQFWDIRMRIAVRARDIQNLCRSIEKLINLGKKSVVEPWVVAFLVDASTRYPATHATQRTIARTLDLVTKHITDNHEIWGLCAKYFSFQKFYDEALQCTMREYRAIETEIAGSLTEAKHDADQQRDHDVAQLKRMTSCLGNMTTLLKRLPHAKRAEQRATVIQTMTSVRERFKARTEKVNEQFRIEVDALIENAEVEDALAVYEDQ